MSLQLQFIDTLSKDSDFKVSVFNWAHSTKKLNPFRLQNQDLCNVKIDMIMLSDIDPMLSQFVSKRFDILHLLIRQAADKILSTLPQSTGSNNQQIVLSANMMKIDIQIVNFQLSNTNNVGIEKVREILQYGRDNNYEEQGELMQIQNAVVLKVQQPQTYKEIIFYQCNNCNISFSDNQLQQQYQPVQLNKDSFASFKIKPTSLIEQLREQEQITVQCAKCGGIMEEDHTNNAFELCQRILVLIEQINCSETHKKEQQQKYINNSNFQAYYKLQPEQDLIDQQSIFNNSSINQQSKKRERKILELFLRGEQVSKIKNGQIISFLCFSSVQAFEDIKSRNILKKYKRQRILNRLFCCELVSEKQQFESQILKNKHFILDICQSIQSFHNSIQISSPIVSNTNKNDGEEEEEDNESELHLEFKQLFFGIESIYSQFQTQCNAFTLLPLKMSFLFSFFLSNQNIQEQSQQQLNILFTCTSTNYLPISQIILQTYNPLSDFSLFDPSSSKSAVSELLKAIIKSAGGILLILNCQMLKKEHAAVIQKILNKQEILFPQIEEAVILPCTVWAISNGSLNNKQIIDNNLFDIVLGLERSNTKDKDYFKYLDIFAQSMMETERIIQKQRQNQQQEQQQMIYLEDKNSINEQGQLLEQVQTKEGIEYYFSTAKKRLKSREILDDGNESACRNENQVSTDKIKDSKNFHENNWPKSKEQIQEEKAAYELIHAYVSKARTTSQQKNGLYSLSNVDSISKTANASAFLRKVIFLSKSRSNNENIISQLNQIQQNTRISLVDAFIAVLLNILSRMQFTQNLDVIYIHSFLLNYGVSYNHSVDKGVIPQEREFYLALEKIQDMIADFIDID